MNIIVRYEDGTEFDITDGVRVLYDCTVGSMDWGSGFFDTNEVMAVRAVARSCGFEVEPYKQDQCDRCGHQRSYHWPDTAPEGRCAYGSTVVSVNGEYQRRYECDCPGLVVAP